MDRTVMYTALLVGFSAMVGVQITRGVRRRESLQRVLDGALFPGVFVLICLGNIFPRWWTPLFAGVLVLLLGMIWSLIRSKRH